MAKQTQDREDLLRDATAMPFRGRTVVDGIELFAGFRSGGQFSLYWGQDPVLQFDQDGALRRVFADSKRFTAQDSALFCLVRSTVDGSGTTSRLALDRQRLGESEMAEMIEFVENHLRTLHAVLNDSSCPWDVVGESEVDFTQRVRDVLETIGSSVRVAATANA